MLRFEYAVDFCLLSNHVNYAYLGEHIIFPKRQEQALADQQNRLQNLLQQMAASQAVMVQPDISDYQRAYYEAYARWQQEQYEKALAEYERQLAEYEAQLANSTSTRGLASSATSAFASALDRARRSEARGKAGYFVTPDGKQMARRSSDGWVVQERIDPIGLPPIAPQRPRPMPPMPIPLATETSNANYMIAADPELLAKYGEGDHFIPLKKGLDLDAPAYASAPEKANAVFETLTDYRLYFDMENRYRYKNDLNLISYIDENFGGWQGFNEALAQQGKAGVQQANTSFASVWGRTAFFWDQKITGSNFSSDMYLPNTTITLNQDMYIIPGGHYGYGQLIIRTEQGFQVLDIYVPDSAEYRYNDIKPNTDIDIIEATTAEQYESGMANDPESAGWRTYFMLNPEITTNVHSLWHNQYGLVKLRDQSRTNFAQWIVDEDIDLRAGGVGAADLLGFDDAAEFFLDGDDLEISNRQPNLDKLVNYYVNNAIAHYAEVVQSEDGSIHVDYMSEDEVKDYKRNKQLIINLAQLAGLGGPIVADPDNKTIAVPVVSGDSRTRQPITGLMTPPPTGPNQFPYQADAVSVILMVGTQLFVLARGDDEVERMNTRLIQPATSVLVIEVQVNDTEINDQLSTFTDGPPVATRAVIYAQSYYTLLNADSFDSREIAIRDNLVVGDYISIQGPATVIYRETVGGGFDLSRDNILNNWDEDWRSNNSQ